MKYSIVYIETRPEIQERLSVGLILVDGNIAQIRTSQKKLKAAEVLLSDKEFRFISRTLAEMRVNAPSIKTIDYLTRYSNNLITISPLQTIDIENTSQNKDWLYRNYVYNKNKKSVLSA